MKPPRNGICCLSERGRRRRHWRGKIVPRVINPSFVSTSDRLTNVEQGFRPIAVDVGVAVGVGVVVGVVVGVIVVVLVSGVVFLINS